MYETGLIASIIGFCVVITLASLLFFFVTTLATLIILFIKGDNER